MVTNSFDIKAFGNLLQHINSTDKHKMGGGEQLMIYSHIMELAED